VARVEGRVQGVGFRAFVVRRARERHLRGWTRNLPDGAVEVVAEGPEDDLVALLADLRRGPPAASVTAVHEQWEPPRGEPSGFGVKP